MTELARLEAKLDAIASDLSIDRRDARRKALEAQQLAQQAHPLRIEKFSALLAEIVEKHGLRGAIDALENLAGREPRHDES